MRNSFKIEMRDTKTRAVEKARAVMIKVYEEMKVTFDKEFKNVVDQYNEIIYQMKKMENRVRQV
jgi:16S rRNA G1207 methylase RsmC